MSDASARLKVVALIPLYLNMSDDPQQRLQVDAATELLLNVQHFLGRRMVIHQNAGAEATLQNVSSIIGRHAVLSDVIVNPSRLLMKHPSRASPHSLLDILLSNYAAAKQRWGGSFSHCVHVTSNERFVRPGAAAHAVQYDAGVSLIYIAKCTSDDGKPSPLPARLARGACNFHNLTQEICNSDPLMQQVYARVGGSLPSCYSGQMDGAFLSRELVELAWSSFPSRLRPGHGNASLGAQFLSPPTELYAPSLIMNARPRARIAPSLTWMNWSDFRGDMKQRLTVEPGDVEAVRAGRWPGAFAVKRVQANNLALRAFIAGLQ